VRSCFPASASVRAQSSAPAPWSGMTSLTADVSSECLRGRS